MKLSLDKNLLSSIFLPLPSVFPMDLSFLLHKMGQALTEAQCGSEFVQVGP